jgi:hypothetical protein
VTPAFEERVLRRAAITRAVRRVDRKRALEEAARRALQRASMGGSVATAVPAHQWPAR